MLLERKDKMAHKKLSNNKNKLFNELQTSPYPRYWFVGIIFSALILIVFIDLSLYKEFNNNQLQKAKTMLGSISSHISSDLMQLNHRLLQINVSNNIEYKSESEINRIFFSSLSLEPISSNIAIKPLLHSVENIRIINQKTINDEYLNIHSLNEKLYLEFNQPIGKEKNLQLSLDIEKVINLYLSTEFKSKYKNFVIYFKFNNAGQEYILTSNDKVGGLKEKIKDSNLYIKNNLHFVAAKNISFYPQIRLEAYIEQSVIQKFLRLLLKISLLIIIITLIATNYLYKKFYHLEQHNLNLIKTKRIFQQYAENTLASIQDGVIITNSSSQILYINKMIEDYLQITLEDVYLHDVTELLPELEIIKYMNQEKLSLYDSKIMIHEKEFYFDIQIAKLHESQNYIGAAICMHDLTIKKAAQARINYLAYHDDFTGLPNKVSLLDYYQDLLRTHSFTSSQYKIFTLVINIASLKNINDTIGYENGDQTLKALLIVLKGYLTVIKLQNHLFRVSEDNFALSFLYDDNTYGKSCILYVTNILKQLSDELDKPIHIAEQNVYLQFSFGVSIFPDNFIEEKNDNFNNFDSALLLRYAEIAMSAARRKGTGKYIFYSEDINLSLKEKFHLENELRNAIRTNELELLFHPQVATQTGKLIGFEILVRWRRKDNRIILPGTFIPLLEKSGLIVTVGDWILKEACLQGLVLLSKGIVFDTLSVNVSGLQLQTDNFIERFKNIIDETGFPRTKLGLEVTENILFDNPKTIIKTLQALRQEGVKIALDDFGTGFSSLNYIKCLPLDCLKIDKEFVQEIKTGDTRLLEAILAIAKSLNLETVAEGVETLEEVTFLRKHLCDIIQGYYISKPLSVDAVITYFGSNSKY